MRKKVILKAVEKPKEQVSQVKRASKIRLVSRPSGNWNPFQVTTKCIICWKPLNDNSPIMECPHCHSKAHQEHMLRWLKKKDYCPYCNKKW